MQRRARSWLLRLSLAVVLLSGIGLAFVRSDNVSERIPSREEWVLHSLGELPPEPRSLRDLLDTGSHLGVPRTVAIATVGSIARESPQEPRPPTTGPTPSPIGRGPTTDYALRLDEVLSPGASDHLRAGSSVTLRLGGPPSPDYFTPFPHPRPGSRLLLVLVPHSSGEAGVYTAYPHVTADVSAPTAHLTDAWRTSVKVMGAPEATPAFIEAVRAALAVSP